MRRILKRAAGIALIAAGVAGLIFSLAGWVVLGRVRRRIEPGIREQLDLIDRTLAATAEGLDVAEVSLGRAVATMGSLETTMMSIGNAIGDTTPMVTSVTDLLNEELTATIEATQAALRTVAVSARLVDEALALLTAIPFVGVEGYDPEVSLHEGLLDVIDSLSDIPTPLGAAERGLNATGENLDDLEKDFTTMGGNVGAITQSLEDAHGLVSDYQAVVAEWTAVVTSIQAGLTPWLRRTRWVLSFLLAWLSIAQIGLLAQGYELFRRSGRKAAR